MDDLALFPALQPDLPGYVHGIISVDPPIVQCDGCGHTHTESTLAYTVLLSGIIFNSRGTDRRRLCKPCRVEAGWDE